MYQISLYKTPSEKIKEITTYQNFKLTTLFSLQPDYLEFQTITEKIDSDIFSLGRFITVEDKQNILFRGRLKKISPSLTKDNKYIWHLSAVSLAASLNNFRLQTTFTDLTISQIVKSILDGSQLNVTYNSTTIAESYQKLTISFNHTLARALTLLAELAGGYEVYLKDNLLYFQPPARRANKFWRHSFEKSLKISQNSQNIVNAVIIKGARLADQTYLCFTKEDNESIDLYGRQEKIILARNLEDRDLAEKLADLILERYAFSRPEGSFLAESGDYQLGDIVEIKGIFPKSEEINFYVNKMVYTDKELEVYFSQQKGELSELIEAFTVNEEALELITISLNTAVNTRVPQFALSGLQFYKNYYSPTQTYEQGSLSYSNGYLYLPDEPFPWYLANSNIQPKTTPPFLKDLPAHHLLYTQLVKDNASSDDNGIISHHSSQNKIYAAADLNAPANSQEYYYVELGRWDNSVTPARLTLINGGETTLYGDDLRVGTLNADLVNVESTAGSNAIHIGNITEDKGDGGRIILGNWVTQSGGVGANSGLLCKHSNGDYTILNASGLLLKSGNNVKRYLYNSLSGTLAWITDISSSPSSPTNDPTGYGIIIREAVITVPDTSIKTINEWLSSIIVSPLKTHPYQAGSQRTTNLTLLNADRTNWVTVTPNDLEYLEESYTDIYVDNCVIVNSTTLKYYIAASIQYVLDNHPSDGYCYWGVGLTGGVRQIIWFLAL